MKKPALIHHQHGDPFQGNQLSAALKSYITNVNEDLISPDNTAVSTSGTDSDDENLHEIV